MRRAAIAAALFAAACASRGIEAERSVPGAGGIDRARAEAAVAEMRPKVAEIRGLPFLRSVSVRVASDAEARGYVTKRIAEFAPKDRLRAEERAFALLGLLPEGTDLERVYLEIVEEQAGGFYDPPTKSFFLLADMPASLARSLAAHELVHALEDQHFDLDFRLRDAGDDDDLLFARSAVHEGTATLVMTLVLSGDVRTGTAPREELDAFRETEAGRGDSLERMPEILRRELLGAYFAGASFVLRGHPLSSVSSFPIEDANRAYREGPRSSEQILHPEKYWDPERFDPPKPVRLPNPRKVLGPGWRVVSSGTLGELSLGVLVGAPTPSVASTAHIPPSAWTNEAAAGWGGDRWALWDNEGRAVAVLLSVWDSERDAEEFASALLARGPTRAIRRRGDRVGIAEGDLGPDERDALLAALVGDGEPAAGAPSDVPLE